jgi:16S rRNA (cytosine1407-C5)-methyltransferase
MPRVNPDFEKYYFSLYGERWKDLRAGLFTESAAAYGEGLTAPYFLNYASVLAAKSLRLPPGTGAGEKALILDACAAPGGKSLVLASLMRDNARLLSNELSPERRRRLSEVLNKHLSAEKRARVTVSGFDAAALGGRKNERGRFDAILLDAPCSGEQHVIKSQKALSAWTKARPGFLSARQWALLSSAFLLLKPGGSLVYSTCALTPVENDGVAGKLLKKYKGEAGLDEPDFDEGEKTEYGRIILPDTNKGLGPMYVARFRKLPSA